MKLKLGLSFAVIVLLATTVLVATTLLVATTANAKVVTQSVTYQHDNATLEGFLAFDDSVKGKRPGVLVVHEWWGLNDYARKRATQLAGSKAFVSRPTRPPVALKPRC